MKKIITLIGALIPGMVFAHAGHEKDRMIKQIFNLDHIIFYTIPTLIIILLIIKYRKAIISYFKRDS